MDYKDKYIKYKSKYLELRKFNYQTGGNNFNELLVNQFLNKKIFFSDIVRKLLLIMRSNRIKNYLKINKITHINDVFKTYNFCKGILN